MRAFIDTFERWTRGGALEIEVPEASDERFDFNVTRCRYAEMYREMGPGGIGHLLSCNRDAPSSKASIRGSGWSAPRRSWAAPCCTFRYRLASPELRRG